MRGIAAGSGVSFDDIVLINARTEIIAKACKLALQVIIDPAGLTMDIAAMPSFGQSFTRYSIEGEPRPVD